jgi:hypothetical protein
MRRHRPSGSVRATSVQTETDPYVNQGRLAMTVRSMLSRPSAARQPTSPLTTVFTIALGVLGFASHISQASTVSLVPWPAPGGATVTNNGVLPIAPGGRTFTFTGFNPSAYDELYYVVGDYPGPGFVANGPRLWTDNTPDGLTFNAGQSNFAGGAVVWTGSTTLSLLQGTYNTQTRFTLTVKDLASNPLGLVDATTIAGMPASVGAALLVPASGYTANWYFELLNPLTNTWGSARSVFDGLSTVGGYSLNSSVGGAFYSSAPEVPLPAAVWLLISGLGGMGLIARRRPTTV